MLLKRRYEYVEHPVQQSRHHLQGCFGSNGEDPQLEFTSVTSTDLPPWAPTEALRPHMLHQSGCRLFWNYRNQHITWSETYHKELRLHLASWPGPLYRSYPDQANPSDTVQKTLGHSGKSLLGHDCLLQYGPSALTKLLTYVLYQHCFDALRKWYTWNKQSILKFYLARSHLLHQLKIKQI